MNNLLIILIIVIVSPFNTASSQIEQTEKITTTSQNNNVGSISGIIKARGVRDARNILVYIEGVVGDFQPQKEKPVVDQVNLIFVPHILPILVGTTVLFTNNDKVKHNIFSPSKCCKFNLGTYGTGIVREVKFDKLGKAALLCNVHAEMSAYIIVLENPYFVLTDSTGIFSIDNIPTGTYMIKTWHEKLKEKKQEVTILDEKTITVEFKLTR